MTRLLPILLLLAACGRAPTQVEGASPSVVLERARARPTPDPIRARLHLKLKSAPMDLSSGTGGVLIVDRPGRGHLAIMGPLGGPVATVTSDGTALAVHLPRDQRVLDSPTAQEVLAQATEGQLGLDDLVGMLLGDLPFDDAKVKSRKPLDDGTVHVVLAGPNATRLDVILEPDHATPTAIEVVEKTGRVLLTADFEPFEARDDGTFVPSRVELYVPALAVSLDLRFKSWEILDEVPPVFDTSAPEGWTVEPLSGSFLVPPDAFSSRPAGHP